jgi:hypothetical protein
MKWTVINYIEWIFKQFLGKIVCDKNYIKNYEFQKKFQQNFDKFHGKIFEKSTSHRSNFFENKTFLNSLEIKNINFNFMK